jgi:hypothetical protein
MTTTTERTKNGYSAPTGLDISLIDPALHRKYSPNLYAFLRARKHSSQLRLARVFIDQAGVEYLGFLDDTGCLIGARLTQVLCDGAKTAVVSYCGGNKWRELTNFWSEYIEDGRCALDRAHKMPFIGSEHRWHVAGGIRKCLWCNKASQVLKRTVKEVVSESWEPANSSAE